MRTIGYIVCVGAILTGCTSVSIIGDDGGTKVTRSFGVLSVQMSPSTDAIVAEMTGFGIASSPTGKVAGFSNQTLLFMTPSCKLVVWIENEAQAEKINTLLAGREDVCMYSRGRLAFGSVEQKKQGE